MSRADIDDACVELAETYLDPELSTAESNPVHEARVLSLAAAIHEAVKTWYAFHPPEEMP
jgi:hypothetical protein